MSSRLRLLLAALASAVLVVPLTWMWWTSLMPDEYSVMDMGYVDRGGGPDVGSSGAQAVHAGHAHGEDATSADGGTDIATLVERTDRPPDVRLDLEARQERFRLGSGEQFEGYTLNGSSPGPTVRAGQGDLVAVTLSNGNIPEGVTLHWHGLDVPNAMDGVAGVTQDAVRPGESFEYRFVAEQVGTYWYHSHQVSHEQVRRGLLGAVVVLPRSQAAPADDIDVEALMHMYGPHRTLNGRAGDLRVDAAPGDVVRVRVINTDNGPMTTWVSHGDYRIVAVDGTRVNQRETVSDQAVVVTAGGRVDLQLVVPRAGARVELAGRAVVLGGAGADPVAERRPASLVDLLTYGEPAPTGLDLDRVDRRFDYVIDRRPGFHDGRPGVWWSLNGRLWPDVPMYTVTTGDVVVMRVENNSGEVHPMHLHGHHAVVLERNGRPATGSPWWVDSLNVLDGETYEIAFVADNPGVWMDHCHNLPHAAEGLVAHLMYDGYTTPFRIGGDARNEPE
jgi:FtsP/CotA-like multicopper oxidase with cupredoxin domain